MNVPARTHRHGITGGSAVEIARSVERSVREGRLPPASLLPTVRDLARELGVSPTTVAAAYRTLRQRGILTGRGRSGTAIATAPPLRSTLPPAPPAHARNLLDGNPDTRLLPDLGPVLARIDSTQALYGVDAHESELLRLATKQLEAEKLPSRHLAVVSGALDGIERVLMAQLRAGDRVIVEDPGFFSVYDLLASLGMTAVPVPVDDLGMIPDALETALTAGADAVVLTPRAQNPTGGAFDSKRVRELRRVLKPHPELLVIEDDHVVDVAGVPALSVCNGRERFALLRSVSKSLGPDLRLAILSGDAETVARVEGRQRIGTRWVSHLLQRTVCALWQDGGVTRRLREAERTYTQRREALLRALAERSIPAHGRSGLNVWIPVPEEAAMITALLDAGWAVAGGARFRLHSAPAIRVTTASLDPRDAPALADAIAAALGTSRGSVTA